MKGLIVSICAAAALAVAAPCFAADSPWDGTWKLNQAKSKLTGDTFTLTDTGGGKMHLVSGAVAYDFACDGKDYATIGDRSVACTKNSDTSYDMTFKAKGTVLAKTHREISADGKTVTATTRGTQPDGTAYTNINVFTRVSGGPGLAGKWKNVKSESSAADVIRVKLSPPDAIHWELPGFKETADGKMDGKPVALVGPTVPAGLTIAFTKVSPSRISYEVKLKEKTLNVGAQTVSADGKILTDTSWDPLKPTEKEVDVYEKQ